MLATTSSRPGRRPDPTVHTLWQQRLLRFEHSGLSVSAFCDREGVSTPSFYAWRRRLRIDPSAAPDGPRFLPVRVLAVASPVELVLPGGAVLRLTSGCDLAFVRSLVDSLGGAPC
jgi:transposase